MNIFLTLAKLFSKKQQAHGSSVKSIASQEFDTIASDSISKDCCASTNTRSSQSTIKRNISAHHVPKPRRPIIVNGRLVRTRGAK